MSNTGNETERSLWEPLGQSRSRRPLLRVWQHGDWRIWTWDEWREQAWRFAGGLQSLGVQPGDRVACLLTNTPSTCAAVLGTWLAGGCLVSVPAVARGMAAERYITQLRRIVEQAEPSVLLLASSYVEAMREACPSVRISALEGVDGPPISEPALAGENEPVFIQYSSGSTTDPRGCVLSAKAIARQLGMLERALELDCERDSKVDWLPLSHDMGLFACLLMTAYWTGTSQTLSTPGRFVTNPGSWFADCASFGATLTCVPNFALELAARVAHTLSGDPIPMRRLVVGGERVDPNTLRRACEALGAHRLPPQALMPAYGMAEAVLAVTMSPLGQGPTVLEVEREALSRGLVQPTEARSAQPGKTTLLTSAGPPLAGNEVGIVDGGDVGEVRVRSMSLADGYLHSPELTRERFTPAGLLTGDIGFVQDRNLYITGRLDDLLFVAGRNVYARDIESALVQTGAVRPGSCAVVQVPEDPERLVAVLEPFGKHSDLTSVGEQMREMARKAAGVRLTECLFLPHGQFPKTPSGKTQRFRCQELATERSVPGGTRVTC